MRQKMAAVAAGQPPFSRAFLQLMPRIGTFVPNCLRGSRKPYRFTIATTDDRDHHEAYVDARR
jgi:hypothetical protein